MKKLSLSKLASTEIEVLKRDQLKKILGGLAFGSTQTCITVPCTVYDSDTGVTYTGNCGFLSQGGGEYICECNTSLGVYQPSNNVSGCVMG